MTKKPVGLNYFKAKAKELEETEFYYFNEEKSEYITYSLRFSQSKIDETMKELVETMIHFQEKGVKEFEITDNVIKYLEFLIFKNFTDTEKLLKGKDFEYKLNFSKTLYDLGVIRLFIDHVFDSIEIDKVLDQLSELNNKVKNLIPEIEKYEKEYNKLEKFKNK